MEKRGWTQNKYQIKTFLKEIFYENSNSILNNIFISHSLTNIEVKKRILKI